MTADDTILIDPPGLRLLGRELQAAAETALELRDRVCVEECSLLPSSTSALADEILQGARQQLHGLAGAYSTNARALVSRADEVEASEARWWGVSADGMGGGVILSDGTYVQQPGGPTSTAISAAWGSGVGAVSLPNSTMIDLNMGGSGSVAMPGSTTIDLGFPGTGFVNMPSSSTTIDLGIPGSGLVNMPNTTMIDLGMGGIGTVGMPNTSVIDLQIPGSGIGSVGMPGTGTIDVLFPGIGSVGMPGTSTIEINIPALGSGSSSGFGGLYVDALRHQQELQSTYGTVIGAVGPGGLDWGSWSNLQHVMHNTQNTFNQAQDPSRSSYNVDLSGTSDGYR